MCKRSLHFGSEYVPKYNERFNYILLYKRSLHFIMEYYQVYKTIPTRYRWSVYCAQSSTPLGLQPALLHKFLGIIQRLFLFLSDGLISFCNVSGKNGLGFDSIVVCRSIVSVVDWTHAVTTPWFCRWRQERWTGRLLDGEFLVSPLFDYSAADKTRLLIGNCFGVGAFLKLVVRVSIFFHPAA